MKPSPCDYSLEKISLNKEGKYFDARFKNSKAPKFGGFRFTQVNKGISPS